MRFCEVEGCERPHVARGFCDAHYRRVQKGKDPHSPVASRRRRNCSLCDNSHFARGYCEKHYRRWERHGDPNVTRRKRKTPKDYNQRLLKYLKCECNPRGGDVRTVEGWAADGRRLIAASKEVYRRSGLYCKCNTEEM